MNIANSEFVLEFVVHSIACRNTAVKSSPIVVSLPGCVDITLNAKSATVCKITYERGKRISFSHSHLLNLKASFVLVQGHGDSTVRASCSFDFFEIMQAADEQVPTVYDVEIGMDRPGGERFGVMYCSFQVIPTSEFKTVTLIYPSLKTNKTERGIPRPATSATRPRSFTTKKAVTIQRQADISASRTTSAVPTMRTACVPDLTLQTPPSSRSMQLSSIHDRYMKKNEMWLGPHCSTHSETADKKSRIGSRASSRQSNGILGGRTGLL